MSWRAPKGMRVAHYDVLIDGYIRTSTRKLSASIRGLLEPGYTYTVSVNILDRQGRYWQGSAKAHVWVKLVAKPKQPAPMQGLPLGAPAGETYGPGGGVVGTNLAPGVWHSTDACSSSLNDQTIRGGSLGTMMVELRVGDTFSTACSWKGGYPPASKARKAGPGMHLVGHDMRAGTWTASGAVDTWYLNLRWQFGTGWESLETGDTHTFTTGQMIFSRCAPVCYTRQD